MEGCARQFKHITAALLHMLAQLLLSPLAVQERRRRMRGRRVPLLLAIAAGLPVIVFFLRLRALWASNLTPAQYLRWSAATGHELFLEIMTAEAVCILLILPALLAGAFAGERESHRLEALLLTPLTDEELLFGKLGAPLLFMFILLCCALPTATMAFILGGVSPAEVVACLLIIFAAAGMHGMLCLYHSLGASTVVKATVWCYLSFITWMIVLLALGNEIAFALVPLAVLLAALITGLREEIITALGRRRHHRLAGVLLFVLLAGVLTIIPGAVYNVYDIVRHHSFSTAFFRFAAVFTAIPAMLSSQDDQLTKGVLWGIVYLVIHLVGLTACFPWALRRLQRLRPGYVDLAEDYQRYRDAAQHKPAVQKIPERRW